jgi:hypothetical protein
MVILATILEVGDGLKIIFLVSGFLLFLCVTPLWVFFAIHAKNHYLATYEEQVAPALSEGHYVPFSFHYHHELQSVLAHQLLPIKGKPDEDGTGYAEGTDQGYSFFSFGYQHMKAEKGHPDSANGRYVEITLKEKKDYDLLLLSKKGPRYFKAPSLKESFESESLLIRDRYALSTSDHEKALRFLSPAALSGILSFAESYPG